MNQGFRHTRAAHASVSIGVLGLALFLAVGLIASFLTQFNARLNALKARTDSAAALTLRLEESRAEIRKRLHMIGAAPRDLETIASPEAAKALVNNACAVLTQSIKAACAMEETPLTATLALHQARLTARGPMPQIVFAMTTDVAPPLSITSLNIKPGGDENLVDVSALIEVAGARSEGPES